MKKLYVTALCCVLVTVTAVKSAEVTREQAEVAKVFAYCVQQTGVEKKLIIKARKGEFVEDDRLDNFIFCMFRSGNIISENGTLNLDVIRSKIPPNVDRQEAERLINTCGYVYGRTPQNAAGNAYKCYIRASANRNHYARSNN